MSPAGVRNLCFMEGNMDKYLYLDILKKNVLSSAEKLSLGATFTFQKDNCPKHTSKICQEWCLYHFKQQLYSPPQSPDLNPIEHVWGEISRELRKYNIKNKFELKADIKDKHLRTTKTLAVVMPQHLREVI
ncbi:Transposable element Tcb1 transposase [Araneus ventricosus]|uniref:Transposable element Tcb1 transposase n=1 Tax=Araneus ventricosus TaxID=182803 RepID=A0A4Y2E1R1_ARAVE|nr:Transposable element Tcb1 transposase [Araneus ventricosus]